MQTEKTIQQLALIGSTRVEIEATIGHAFTKTETDVYNKARTMRRLKRAKEAQAAARKRREEIERQEKENLDWWMSGATRSIGDPLPNNAAKSATDRSRAFRPTARSSALTFSASASPMARACTRE